jgi:hypothetical protein
MKSFKEMLFADVTENLQRIIDNYQFELSNSNTRLKILNDLSKCIIKGVGDCRLMYVKNSSPYFNTGDIIKNTIIRSGKKDYPLSDYLVQLTLIKMDKAFIKVK